MTENPGLAIREAFNAQNAPMGQWCALTVTVNEKTSNMLCRQNRTGARHTPDSIDIVTIQPGKLLSYLPTEALAHTFKLTGSNELSLVATAPADSATTILWLARGLPVLPHMTLPLEKVTCIRRYNPNEYGPPPPSSEPADLARENPLQLVRVTNIRPSGSEWHHLYMALEDKTLLHLNSAPTLPTPEQTPGLLAVAIEKHNDRLCHIAEQAQQRQAAHDKAIQDAIQAKANPAFESKPPSKYQPSLFDDQPIEPESTNTQRPMRLR